MSDQKTQEEYALLPRIDERVIDNLRELGNPDDEEPFLDSLIQLYFRESASASKKLGAAILEEDRKAMEHFSHKLKGLSRNLGLRRISEIYATIERGSAHLSGDEGQALFELSRAELEQVLVALKHYETHRAA